MKYSYMLFNCILYTAHWTPKQSQRRQNHLKQMYIAHDSWFNYFVLLLLYCNTYSSIPKSDAFIRQTETSYETFYILFHNSIFSSFLFYSPFILSKTFQHVTCIWYKWNEQISQVPASLFIVYNIIPFCTKYIRQSNNKNFLLQKSDQFSTRFVDDNK